MIAKYNHISFDLDGTLVRTIPEYRYKIVPEVVKNLGGEINSEKHIDQFWFESGRNQTIQAKFNLDSEKFWELFREVDTPEERSRHTFAFEDAGAVLSQIKKLGKTVSIITGAPDWIAKMEIEKLGPNSHDYYFSISSSEFDEKPDPGPMHHTLDQLNHKPHETLYIGNSNEDAAFAKNAGCDFLYLERGEHEFENTDWMIGKIQSLHELFSPS